MQELLIKNGLVIDPALGEARRDLLLAGGKVRRLALRIRARPGVAVYDASGLWVFPGFIDAHVHAREPGAVNSETIDSAARAAAAGGISSILLMPNTVPPVASPRLVKWSRRRAARAPVNVYIAASATAGRAGRFPGDLAALKTAGARAFTDDGAGIPARLLPVLIERAAAAGLPLLDHPEDMFISGAGAAAPAAAARLGIKGIPDKAEWLAVLRGILAASTAGRLHLQHLSLGASVSAVRLAKRSGWPVTAETCPHYFSLSSRDIKADDADFKMKPPLRSMADRLAVLKALADGTIDLIASDHAPHAPRLKAAGFKSAPFGVIGLETLVPVCVSELVLSGRISRPRLAELLSAAPARLLGLKNKGSLRPGADADITVVDPRLARRVPGVFVSRSANSPFKGRMFKGWPVLTVVGGKIVYRAA